MKRILATIAVLSLLIVVGSLVYVSTPNRQAGHVDGVKLFMAANTFTAELKAEGQEIPTSVSLKELISRGLLNEADVSGFAGMKVTLSLSADLTDPQDVLIHGRLPDGTEFVTLADGRVQ